VASLQKTFPASACDKSGRKLNLRRRDWGATRKEKLDQVAGEGLHFSFAFPADAAVLAIFKDYTTFGEFLADFVAFGEVAPLPRCLSLGHFHFDF
jgi:hypothetical protein